MVDALERLGQLEGFTLEPIEPAVSIWGYRNKFEYSWSQTGDGAVARASTWPAAGTG